MMLDDDVAAAIPAEKRLLGLAPEDRLRGWRRKSGSRVSCGRVIAGLSDEQAARLRELFERRSVMANCAQ